MPAPLHHSTRRRSLLLVAFALTLARPWASTPVGAAEEVPGLAGAWTWSWKDTAGQTHRHLLEVEGLGAKVAARERFDDLEPAPVQNLQVAGKNIRFTIVRGNRSAEYRGILADRDSINGTVLVTFSGETSEDPWEATRVKPTK